MPADRDAYLAAMRQIILRRKPPIPIPGYGGYVAERDRLAQRPDNTTNPLHQHDDFGPPRQQAPFKPGQAKRTQAYKRRHPGTRPTPGSVYRRGEPGWS